MSTLSSKLRGDLEKAAKKARSAATIGAQKSLEALAVHEPDPYRHMDEAQRTHRRKLRAQAKQLGDGESQTKRGAYEITHLVEKLAYDQWHRLLFARFLLENQLLISPEHGVAVSLDDCEELAPSLGLKDAWAVAARFAAVELPEIFRADDPAGGVELPVEDRKGLIQLVTGLPVEVFTASDSLGWCYQFWQVERKEQVNAAGNKIGAEELPSVTQLFTEDYMVDFLLDNTLGAWWAGKQLALNPQLSTLNTEQELRQAVSLPGCEWKYLRFIKSNSQPSTLNSQPHWTPAAGTFDGWPASAAAIKALDPCMGSGHFVVAMFERLVALRLAEETLDEAAAVAAVLRDNLFGLEIDPRCTQIAAFNLALAAWRRVGHCKLPAMNLACSGLAPNSSEADWLAMAGDNQKLQRGMERLYGLFQKAAVLGSLINPRADEDDLLVAAFHELQPLLEKALAQETKDDTAHEMAVTARGLAKAAEILAGQFTLVATNVPYLGRGKQDDTLKDFCERVYDEAKTDLAACFVERCLQFCKTGGSSAVVTPQSWHFQDRYSNLRKRLLIATEWNFVAPLGARAFETIGGERVNVSLSSISANEPSNGSQVYGLDASDAGSPHAKASSLQGQQGLLVPQANLRANPDARIVLEDMGKSILLQVVANSWQGIKTSDDARFTHLFWEFPREIKGWRFYQRASYEVVLFAGRHEMIFWEDGFGQLTEVCQKGASFRGKSAWSKSGVAVCMMGNLPATLYTGERFSADVTIVEPKDPLNLPAIWTFCSSPHYAEQVAKIDPGLKATNTSFGKIPFDLAHWQKVAAEKYPHGLPKPFSSDPTQWLFNGHPAGADQPLHVAVARLLGYQWPRQTGSSFPDCPALGPDGLETLADEDGIVSISPAKGEGPAAERLRALLTQALGKVDLNALIASAGPKGSKSQTLEDWLRDEFFEQHCAIFHHRPFVWQIWDGLRDGFSVLVNYHKLTHAGLEKLTYSYLGDWIRRQQAAVEAGESGSDAKLQAAKHLQATLKLILEGEPPYDLFVRWKPLSQQAIGWHPDLNDGVRMNIRPFLSAPDVGKKGAGLLRAKPNIKWEKDRGKEPTRPQADYPWFYQGTTFTGDRLNDIHLTLEMKKGAKA